jgi:hypothetical protein
MQEAGEYPAGDEDSGMKHRWRYNEIEIIHTDNSRAFARQNEIVRSPMYELAKKLTRQTISLWRVAPRKKFGHACPAPDRGCYYKTAQLQEGSVNERIAAQTENTARAISRIQV